MIIRWLYFFFFFTNPGFSLHSLTRRGAVPCADARSCPRCWSLGSSLSSPCAASSHRQESALLSGHMTERETSASHLIILDSFPLRLIVEGSAPATRAALFLSHSPHYPRIAYFWTPPHPPIPRIVYSFFKPWKYFCFFFSQHKDAVCGCTREERPRLSETCVGDRTVNSRPYSRFWFLLPPRAQRTGKVGTWGSHEGTLCGDRSFFQTVRGEATQLSVGKRQQLHDSVLVAGLTKKKKKCSQIESQCDGEILQSARCKRETTCKSCLAQIIPPYTHTLWNTTFSFPQILNQKYAGAKWKSFVHVAPHCTQSTWLIRSYRSSHFATR